MKADATQRKSASTPVPDITTGTADEAPTLMLDDRGMVCDCNRAGEKLFNYRRGEMVWRHVSMLLPQLADVELVKDGQPNPQLRYLTRIGRRFQAVAQGGRRFAGELYLNLLDNTGHGRLSLIVRPAGEDTNFGG